MREGHWLAEFDAVFAAQLEKVDASQLCASFEKLLKI
jgi:hypothetical protein